MNIKKILHIVLTLLMPVVLWAQQPVENEPIRLYFRTGKATIERGYMENSVALDSLAARLASINQTSLGSKARVRIYSSVSPEGSTAINNRLIKERASSISNWITQRFDIQVGYVIDSMGVDWPLLTRLVEASDRFPYKDEVLDIINNTPEQLTKNGKTVNERQVQLESLHQGVPYRYIYKNFYPQLRYAAAYAEIWIAPEITITSPKLQHFASEGGQGTISYKREERDTAQPKVDCNAEWISNITHDGSSIGFRVKPNTVAEERKAVISLNHYDIVHQVEVVQSAAEVAQQPTQQAVTLTAEGDDAVSNPQYAIDRTESVRVYFRQGSATLDRNYMNNDEALQRLEELLQPYVVDGASTKGKILIASSASPEGSNTINERLVKRRAAAISGWIGKRFDTDLDYAFDYVGIDWPTLIALVEESEDVPYKEEVLDILRNTPAQVVRNGRVVNERRDRLQALRNGVPYAYIYKHLYPQMRYAAAYAEIWYASEMTITSESPIKFTCEGGSGVVTFEKNVEDRVVPRVRTSADWIGNIVPQEDKVEFVVGENTMAEKRQAKLFVECYGHVYEVVVEQEGAEPELRIVSESVNSFGPQGGRRTIDFTINTSADVVPTTEENAEWISDIVVTDGAFSYVVAPNEIAEPRHDTITISYFNQTHKVAVEQEGAEPTLTLTTPTPRKFNAYGGTDTLRFKTNSPKAVVPAASSEAPWVVGIVPTEEHIAYQVSRNRSTEPRTAKITVECFDKAEEVAIYQEGRTECMDPFYMSLKTNALYDIALVPNIGVEFYLGHNFTVAANWHYAWWKSDAIKWYWRTYGGDISLRYWFGKAANEKPLTGHHFGPYGQIITYDFALGKRGVLAEPWSWSAGMEYGYSLPLTKNLNLDCTIGVGYHTGTFYEYLPIDTHYVWQATKKRNYIGPTKMEVSLVWLIGCKNYNKIKE